MSEKERTDRMMHDFFHVHRDVSRKFFQSCGLNSGHPITVFQIGKNPGITQKQLSELLEIAPASVAVIVKRLESAGIVYKQMDEFDKRIVHLFLTDQGIEIDNRCKKGKDFFLKHQFKDFSDDELNLFCSMIERMSHNLIESIEDISINEEGGIFHETMDEIH